MADEITFSYSLTVSNGNLKETYRPAAQQIDQTTAFVDGGTQTIGTSSETVTVSGDLTSEGVAIFTNLDATNFIKIGPDSTGQVDFLKLKPGESFPMRLMPGITIKAQADTAACNLRYVILDD